MILVSAQEAARRQGKLWSMRAFGRFVADMGDKMHAKQHKTDWEEGDVSHLLTVLQGEVHELERAVAHESADRVAAEAVDVANCALMIHEAALRSVPCSST